jgi:hypothetical protein
LVDDDTKLVSRPLWDRKDPFNEYAQSERFRRKFSGLCYAFWTDLKAKEAEFAMMEEKKSRERKSVGSGNQLMMIIRRTRTEIRDGCATV